MEERGHPETIISLSVCPEERPHTSACARNLKKEKSQKEKLTRKREDDEKNPMVMAVVAAPPFNSRMENTQRHTNF